MKSKDLTQGPIAKSILILAIPIIVTSLLQVSYNFVDMFFIGQYLPNGQGVTAIGMAGMFQWLATGYILFASIGTQVLIAQSIGEKNKKNEKMYAQSGMLFTLLLALMYSVTIFIFADNIMHIFNINNPETLNMAIDYLRILAIALFFILINISFNGVFQALGQTSTIFIVTGIGVVINIVLDPLLIIHFDMGVVGAGIATVIGAFVSFILYSLILLFKTELFKNFIHIKLNAIKKIFNIGIFVSFQNLFFTGASMVVSSQILQFGDEAQAAVRIGAQIESFTWMVGGGVAAVIATFVGQNFGANNFQRIAKGYRTTMVSMILYGLVISIIFFIYGGNLISVFTKEPSIISIGDEYMKILCFSQIFMLIEGISGGVFNGIGKSKYSAVYGVPGNILRVVLVFTLPAYLGLNGIWIAISLSSIVKGLGLSAHLLYYLRSRYNVSLKMLLLNKKD